MTFIFWIFLGFVYFFPSPLLPLQFKILTSLCCTFASVLKFLTDIKLKDLGMRNQNSLEFFGNLEVKNYSLFFITIYVFFGKEVVIIYFNNIHIYLKVMNGYNKARIIFL